MSRIAGQARTTGKVGSVHDEIIGTVAPSTVAIQRTVNETNSTLGNVTVRSVLHVSATPSSVPVVAVGVNVGLVREERATDPNTLAGGSEMSAARLEQ